MAFMVAWFMVLGPALGAGEILELDSEWLTIETGAQYHVGVVDARTAAAVMGGGEEGDEAHRGDAQSAGARVQEGQEGQEGEAGGAQGVPAGGKRQQGVPRSGGGRPRDPAAEGGGAGGSEFEGLAASLVGAGVDADIVARAVAAATSKSGGDEAAAAKLVRKRIAMALEALSE